MCDPYIHGRTFFFHNSVEHLCQPLRINSHSEFPAILGRVPESILRHSGQGSLDEELLAGGMIMAENGQEVTEVAMVYLDWGIQTWDGKYVPKSRAYRNFLSGAWLDASLNPLFDEPSMDSAEIAKLEALYCPRRRLDLEAYMRAHWGKNGDGPEFADKGALCIDIKGIWTELPPELYLSDNQLLGQDRLQLPRSADPLFRKDLERMGWCADKPSDPGPKYAAAIIAASQQPVNRWAEMFKQAPNEFWAVRSGS